jgi:hypothetical protein
MHIFPANLVASLADATAISVCVLAVGFMLYFLLALAKERKAGLVGYRVEYGISSSLPSAPVRYATRRFAIQSFSTQANSYERKYDRGGSASRAPQAERESMLSSEYSLTDGPRQEPDRA